VSLDVDPVLEAVERDADPDVRGHVVLREHPDVSGRRDRAEPEFAIVREVVARADVREAVLERSRDVSGLQEGLESRPAADLALVAVGGDHALRLDVHLLLEALRVNAADPSIVPQEGLAAAGRGVARGHRARGARPDHHHVVLVRGHRVAGLSIGKGYIRLTHAKARRSGRGYFIVWSLCPRG